MSKTKSLSMEQLWPGLPDVNDYVRVPISLFRCARQAGISWADICLLIGLNSFRWNEQSEIKPSLETLGELLHREPTNIDASIRQPKNADTPLPKLLEMGLSITRGKQGRGHSHKYDLTPLLKRIGGTTAAPAAPPDTSNREVAETRVVRGFQAAGDTNPAPNPFTLAAISPSSRKPVFTPAPPSNELEVFQSSPEEEALLERQLAEARVKREAKDAARKAEWEAKMKNPSAYSDELDEAAIARLLGA